MFGIKAKEETMKKIMKQFLWNAGYVLLIALACVCVAGIAMFPAEIMYLISYFTDIAFSEITWVAVIVIWWMFLFAAAKTIEDVSNDNDDPEHKEFE